MLGGLLTEYLSWRWCLYVNLFFAGFAAVGGALLLKRQPPREQPKLDVLGVVLAGSSMFCLVYGFSNAASHSWHTPSTYGFLAAGVLLLAVFAWWQTRAASPLLPPRIVLDRNRGGSYLAILIQGAGIFGIFLFLTYCMQQTRGFSLPRVGPKPLVTLGMLLAAGSMVWLTRIGVHSTYAAAVLGPLLVTGAGFGLTIATAINTGTFGVAPQDAGVASATVNTGQQIGGSIGTSLLNTIFASAVASYIASHITPGALVHGRPGPQLIGLALVHGYTTAFWWSAAIFASGAVICGTLLRRGPLTQAAVPQGAAAAAPPAHATAE